MEKKTKVVIGVGIAGVLAFLGWKFFGRNGSTNTVATITPESKFTEDGYNPNTPWGAEVKAYLDTTGRYNPEIVKQVIDTHINSVSPQFQRYIARYK